MKNFKSKLLMIYISIFPFFSYAQCSLDEAFEKKSCIFFCECENGIISNPTGFISSLTTTKQINLSPLEIDRCQGLCEKYNKETVVEIKKMLEYEVSCNQLMALLSLCNHIGIGNLENSDLMLFINKHKNKNQLKSNYLELKENWFAWGYGNSLYKFLKECEFQKFTEHED